MFSSENGASVIIDKTMNEYEKHFSIEFPLYEYIHITKNDTFDFSIEGAKRLSEFIDKRIINNQPVNIPNDYEDRLY